MLLGFSTNAFVNFDLIHTINKISEIGYDGVELVLDIPHAFLPMKKDKVIEIGKCVKKNNLRVANLNANTVMGWSKNRNGNKFEPSLSSQDSKLRNWRISYTKQAIELASFLDCNSICLTSGVLHPASKDAELQHFKDSLSILCDFAEKKNVKLAIEYEPELLISNSNDVWKIISKDYRNVGLNLDTCHVEVAGEDLLHVIQKFGKKIIHTHISDCKNAIHYHLLPGLGDIDFQRFLNALKEAQYEGFLTAELYTYHENPESAATTTFQFFDELLRKQ